MFSEQEGGLSRKIHKDACQGSSGLLLREVGPSLCWEHRKGLW